jgi:hypothetical protein
MHHRPKIIVAAALLAAATQATAGYFPTVLSDNGTNAPDSTFLGAPDGRDSGLGFAEVTYDFGDFRIANRAALVDLNVYELSNSVAEFSLIDVLVSQDGLAFVSVKASERAVVDIPGDESHGSTSFARSYDLGGLGWARYVRIDGLDPRAPGVNIGFDLDAIGAHEVMAPVPEPGTWALMLGGAAWLARRCASATRRVLP